MMLLYNEKIFKRCFNHPLKYWYKNLKSIPLYFKLLNHLVKTGYDEYATWETFNWFIDIMKPILKDYNHYRHGTPIVIKNYFEYENTDEREKVNEDAWSNIVLRMIELLDLMDESNPKYDNMSGLDAWKIQDEEMTAAKNEFFELFSKYFYNLWD